MYANTRRVKWRSSDGRRRSQPPAARLLHSPKCLTLLSYIVARQDLPGLFVASHARHERVAGSCCGGGSSAPSVAVASRRQSNTRRDRKRKDGTCVAAGSTIANSFQPSPHGHSDTVVCAYLIFLLNAFHLLPFPSCDPYLIIEADQPHGSRGRCHDCHGVNVHTPWQLSSLLLSRRLALGRLSDCSRLVMQLSFYFAMGWTLIKKRFQV